MKKTFSKKWKASRQVRKQRKYVHNAPLNIKHKLMSSNLSKLLREKYHRRSLPVRKGDNVLILNGEFKGRKGKISLVDRYNMKVYIEAIQKTKKEGTKVNIPFNSTNLQIQELSLDDKKRIISLERTNKKEKEAEKKNV